MIAPRGSFALAVTLAPVICAPGADAFVPGKFVPGTLHKSYAETQFLSDHAAIIRCPLFSSSHDGVL